MSAYRSGPWSRVSTRKRRGVDTSSARPTADIATVALAPPSTAMNSTEPSPGICSNRRARALGFQAKWSIHPDLIDGINATFRPSEADIAWARKVGRALDEARRAGTGSAQIDGRLIEAATMKTVDRILSLAESA